MKVIERQPVVSASLASSTVPETDYAAWASGATYAVGDRVILTATHRIYESAVAANIGHDPASDAINWIDVGPTNRWAMFDAAGGPMTTFAGTITMTIAIDDTAQAIGFADIQAASVALHVVSGGVAISDQTRVAPGTALMFDLPAGTGRTVTVTITPTGGTASVGKLVVGTVLDLGDTEDAPTVGITDFSRRTTDEFGITTVVKRGFALRLTARCKIASSVVDSVERRLAALRALPALWIADATTPGLILYGYFKEFSIDLPVGGFSYCSLSADGLPSAEIPVAVVDPAITGASTFRAVRPVEIDDAALATSNVPETDHPSWFVSTTYALGARVILTATHRIYESLSAGNVGNDPASDTAHWLDVGPTNRWAMFDQALGTVTTRAGNVAVTLTAPSPITTLALLDLSPGTVRVQAPGYDQTKTALGGDGNVALFTGLAAATGNAITVTVTAAAGVALAAIGTLLMGTIEPFGTTEESPSVGINDFSKKTTDDFGNTTAVERAWAKRMTVKTLMATTALDNVVRRLASLRATPTLWLGDDSFDSLAVYGFYKDFSVAVSERSSICSLTIEGLSKAAPEADAGDGGSTPDPGLDGFSTALVYLFKRATSAPAVPTDALTYTFATGVLDGGSLSGWTRAPAAGSDPLYVTVASAISRDASDVIATGDWAAPVIQAVEGGNGLDGLNAATVTLYQRATTPPAVPTDTLTYIFATGVLGGGSLAGWSRTIPVGTDPIYIIAATAIGSAATDTIATGEWAAPAVLAQNGANGANGYSQAQIRLYQRAASTPAVPAATLTYTFATDVLTGSLGAWSRSTPADDGNPLYVTVASAVSNTATDTIASGEWSGPVVLSSTGGAGADGLNTATVFLYKRATSPPAVPSTNLTYTFGTAALTGTLDGWSQSVPGGTDPIYITTATAASTTASDTIATGEWASPNILAQNGANGSNGYSNALVYLFKRAASAPAVPSATLTYTFATDTLAGALSGWSRTPPTADGNPLYVTVASASSTGATDTIAAGEWSSPVVNAQDGGSGTNGLNVATVFLYKRATSAPAVPSSTTTFTFASGVLSGTLSGWSQSLPAGTDPVYYTTATAVSAGSADSIGSGEWAAPQILAQNGIDGAPGVTPTTVALDKSVVVVNADASNATKTGQLPKYVSVKVDKGGVDLTSTATVSVSTSSTAIAASYAYASGVGTITVSQADSEGKLYVTVTVGGVQIGPVLEVPISRPQDPQAPASPTSAPMSFSGGGMPGASYVLQGSSVFLKANSSGVINYSAGMDFTVINNGSGSRSARLTITVAWRAPGGSWNYPTGTQSALVTAGPFNQNDGAVTTGGSLSGLTPAGTYEYQIAILSSGSATSLNYSGEGQVSQ